MKALALRGWIGDKDLLSPPWPRNSSSIEKIEAEKRINLSFPDRSLIPSVYLVAKFFDPSRNGGQ